MGCNVFANGNEVSCKASDHKVVAQFPDVCLSPPSPPAGPIPVPYPDTSFSKDMKNGSKSVKIKNKEIMLKNKSFYKSSPLGNEAATRGLGANVLTHVITGKTYFVAWSMDVKVEGQNVDRHIDPTTSNHPSPMPGTGPDTISKSGAAPDEEPKEELCDCCRTRPKHTEAQQKGEEISEEDFYGEQNKDLIKEIRGHPKCKYLLPNPKAKGCNKYYVTKPAQLSDTGVRLKASEGTANRVNEWEPYKPTYVKKNQDKVSPGQTIGHRVPLTAGGCPVGWGNLQPVEPECEEIDGRLGTAQQNRGGQLQRAKYG